MSTNPDLWSDSGNVMAAVAAIALPGQIRDFGLRLSAAGR